MEGTAATAEPIARERHVPTPLIAGYDGREAGLDALALADTLTTARGDHMIAAYVSEWLPPQAANDRHRQLDVRARLQVLRGAVNEILPDGSNGRPVAIYDVPAHTASRRASRCRDF